MSDSIKINGNCLITNFDTRKTERVEEFGDVVIRASNNQIKLNNKINFTLNAPTITYGDNQNITVTFPSNVNGTIYVTVNNKTYRKYCDNQSEPLYCRTLQQRCPGCPHRRCTLRRRGLRAEKLVHFAFADRKFCAKLPQEYEIEENQSVKLPFDMNKAFLFDKETEKRIR